jgi:hypothetical protein
MIGVWDDAGCWMDVDDYAILYALKKQRVIIYLKSPVTLYLDDVRYLKSPVTKHDGSALLAQRQQVGTLLEGEPVHSPTPLY